MNKKNIFNKKFTNVMGDLFAGYQKYNEAVDNLASLCKEYNMIPFGFQMFVDMDEIGQEMSNTLSEAESIMSSKMDISSSNFKEETVKLFETMWKIRRTSIIDELGRDYEKLQKSLYPELYNTIE
jgi:hypothetical protein